MVETLTDSGAVKIKAGSGASIVITDNPTVMTQLINQAEGELSIDTGIDWVDKWTSLSANLSGAVSSAASNKAAAYVIETDMSGYTSRQESLNMLNVLWASYDRTADRLRDDKVKTLLGVTS